MVILPKEERVQRLSVCLDAPRSGLAFINSHIRDLFQGAVHQQAAAARVLYQYVTKRVCSVRYFIFSVINITFSVWPTSYSSNTSLKYQHVRLEHSCPYSYNIYSSQTRCQRFSPSWKSVRWRWTWCTDTLALSVWWSWSCLLHRLYLFDPQTTSSAAKQQCVRFPHACPILEPFQAFFKPYMSIYCSFWKGSGVITWILTRPTNNWQIVCPVPGVTGTGLPPQLTNVTTQSNQSQRMPYYQDLLRTTVLMQLDLKPFKRYLSVRSHELLPR